MAENIQEALFGRANNDKEAQLQREKMQQFCDDCSKTFNTAHGERVFWFLMEVSRMFSPLPDHGVWNQRAEGMRMIGLLLLSGMGFGHSFGHLAALNKSYGNVKAEQKDNN